MARRYDSRTTTFSPEGRLYQVEYAMEAINNASATLGVLGKDCIVIAADKPVTPKLLDATKTREKVYVIDKHVICAVAGWTADANILIDYARLTSQRYLYAYSELQPIKNLMIQVCDMKQGYTQYGGLRPFGVSFLFAGYDRDAGFRLFHTDPAGNFSGWRATAIGQNNQSAQNVLKNSWKDSLSLDESLELAIRALSKTVDTPKAENTEVAVLYLDDSGAATHKFLNTEEIDELLKRI